jgi:predicted ribosomally synthesized peptide with nif11-like leader
MHSEIERFAKDAATNASLRDQLKAVGTDQQAVVKFANSKGYRFDMSDVKALSESTGGELTDSDLQQVSGGVSQVILAFSSKEGVYATKGRIFIWA